MLRSIEARAQGAAAPLRLLIIHHPLGAAPGLASWRPNASATTTNFTLPSESAPFNAAATPLQKYMCMIDGVNVVTPSGQNTHEGGMVAIMTGVNALGKGNTQQDWAAGAPSIDQLLLDKSPVLGGPSQPKEKQTTFFSLQLGADIRSDRNEVAPHVLSYKAPIAGSDIFQRRQPLTPDTSPSNVYGRIFGGTLPTGADTQKILAQKLSVCDFMRKDIARLQTLIPASEKDRLASQLNSITQLESSLRQMYMPSNNTGGVCTKPAAPPIYANTTTGRQMDSVTYSTGTGVDYYVSGSPNSHPHVDLGQNQLRLIKTAFACDLVRVATFMWSAGTNWVVFPGTFQGATIAGSPQSSPHHPPSHTTDSNTGAWLNQINTFYSAATATVLQEFATTPDIDGNMLLDNTVVVYLTEVARAYDHDQRNMPLIVFGGKNTGVKGGTFLKVTDGTLSGQTGGNGNRPFNDFWLSLLPVFGVDGTVLSKTSGALQSTGPISGIFS